jgi:hypothetical protein
VTVAAKAGDGQQESIDDHTTTTMGKNEVSVQWMIEQGDGQKIERAMNGRLWQWP